MFTGTPQETRRRYNIISLGCSVSLLFGQGGLKCHCRGMLVGTKYLAAESKSLPRFHHLQSRCQQTAQVLPAPVCEVDGDLVSSGVMIWSLPVRRSTCDLPNPPESACEQEGQGCVLSVNVTMKAIIWVVSEREKSEGKQRLGKDMVISNGVFWA